MRRPRRLGLALAALLGAVLLALLAVRTGARRELAALDPPLPTRAELQRFAEAVDLPVRLAWIETAQQPMPRSLVLDPDRDPHPDEPYVMGHPVFVLEWADGRRLLVDAGMEPAAARAFGRPLVWVGAGPIDPQTAAADVLRPALAQPAALGLLLTHLHVDHVGGVSALCRSLPPGRRLSLFQRGAQAQLGNYTTRAARRQLDAEPCLDRVVLGEAGAAAVPGFPGVFVIHAAGHTPGSQVIGVWLRAGEQRRGFLLAGDVANAIDGVHLEVPKPWAYRHFVVPEHEPRLQRMRSFLRDAAQHGGFTVLVSHDHLAIEASGLPRWRPREPAGAAQE